MTTIIYRHCLDNSSSPANSSHSPARQAEDCWLAYKNVASTLSSLPLALCKRRVAMRSR